MIKIGIGKIYFVFGELIFKVLIGFSLIASLYLVYELNTFVVFFGSLIGSIFVYFLQI